MEPQEARVIAARHVTGKVFQGFPDAVNTTLPCYSMEVHPGFRNYSSALQSYGIIVWICGAAVVLFTCILYVLSLRATRKHRPATFTYTAFVLAVYPVVSMTAYIATFVPRARLITEAVGQQSVMIGFYCFYWQLVNECGGFQEFVRRAQNARLETRILPCCCWPCCLLPRPVIKERHLRHIGYVILQLPIVQALLYVISLALWEEDKHLYNSTFMIIQPFVIASILFGVWGVIMCVRAAEAAGSAVKLKFFALQLVLIIVKLQCGLAKGLPEIVALPCFMPLHPSVLVNLVHNSAMILEMLVLSLWAWRLYIVPPTKNVPKFQLSVVTLENGSPESKQFKDCNLQVEGR